MTAPRPRESQWPHRVIEVSCISAATALSPVIALSCIAPWSAALWLVANTCAVRRWGTIALVSHRYVAALAIPGEPTTPRASAAPAVTTNVS